MQQQTEHVVGINRAPARSRQQEVEPMIQLESIKNSIDNLIILYLRHAELGATLADAIEIQAKKAGIKPGVLRKFVTVCGSGKYEVEKMKHGQLSLLFEEVGVAHATAN